MYDMYFLKKISQPNCLFKKLIPSSDKRNLVCFCIRHVKIVQINPKIIVGTIHSTCRKINIFFHSSFPLPSEHGLCEYLP